jgi:hypothetical protein
MARGILNAPALQLKRSQMSKKIIKLICAPCYRDGYVGRITPKAASRARDSKTGVAVETEEYSARVSAVIDFRFGTKVIQVIDAALESTDARKWVALNNWC